jgi:N-acetylglutamate synthase-like GNAT family acetyltransferase
MYTVKLAASPAEIRRIVQLRYKILRQPWDQPITTASDELEERSVNAYIEDNGNVIACGRLQENNNKIGQIRYMAVDDKYQGLGIGKLMVFELENQARKMGLHSIELQARENAVKFYESCGYTVKEKSFLLWGIIQHYLMYKIL